MIALPRRHSLKRNGPVPTGAALCGLAMMSVPSYRWRGRICDCEGEAGSEYQSDVLPISLALSAGVVPAEA